MGKINSNTKIHNPRLAQKAKENMLKESDYTKMATFFKTFADETRLKIIFVLSKTELCVNDISYVISMNQSAVSHQIKLLRKERLVKQRKDGKKVYYSLDDEHVKNIFNIGLHHSSHESELKHL